MIALLTVVAAPAKAKSVINIYLPGGMSHQESFDPKFNAPVEYRGPMEVVRTALDGVYFSENLKETAKIADRIGNLQMLIIATVLIILFGAVFGPLFGSADRMSVLLMLSLGLAAMGLTYGPLGTALSAVFPTAVRYTGEIGRAHV